LALRAMKEIKENLVLLTDLPIHHTTGFSHPKLLLYAVCCFVNLFHFQKLALHLLLKNKQWVQLS